MNVVLLRDLDSSPRTEYFDWINSMTDSDDNECGPDFTAWICDRELNERDRTFVFYLRNSLTLNATVRTTVADGDVLIGTASIVEVDREVIAKDGGYVVGGLNVKREHRGKGYGTQIFALIQVALLEEAQTHGPLVVTLKAEDARAIRMYEKAGFVRDNANGCIYEKTFCTTRLDSSVTVDRRTTLVQPTQ
jgi:GNAT superfamily N-acetyltransferase